MAEHVVDASVAIKWIVQGETFRNKALQLLGDSRRYGVMLIEPPLLEYEVESNLQRRLFHGRATTFEVDASLNAFYAADVQIIDLPDLMPLARSIARHAHQEKMYDSVYAALAELRGCDFWTADRHFYEAVRDELAFVRYMPDYPG